MKCYKGQGWVYTDGERKLAQQCPKEYHIGCRLCSDLKMFESCPGRKKLQMNNAEFLRRRQKWLGIKEEVLKKYREKKAKEKEESYESIPEVWKKKKS